MADAYAKTDAGRREIRERAQSLSRPARNLLLIIDASKPGDTWLKLVQGASAEDLAHLLASGLIGPQPQVEADRRGLAPDRRDAARDSSADRRIVERAAAAAPIADNGPLVQALQALASPTAFAARYGVPATTPVMLFAVGDGNHSLATDRKSVV